MKHWKVLVVGPALALVLSSSACGSSILKAAAAGDIEKVESLLKFLPWLVNARSKYGWTPLRWAELNSHKNVAEIIRQNRDVK